jgi:hypothetical protein
MASIDHASAGFWRRIEAIAPDNGSQGKKINYLILYCKVI